MGLALLSPMSPPEAPGCGQPVWFFVADCLAVTLVSRPSSAVLFALAPRGPQLSPQPA